MATDVSICSNACLLLGATTIASLSPPDATREAEICANLYPQVRDWVLRSHSWACATKRVILAPDAAAPAFDWAYQFSFPDDWLRTLQVGQRDEPIDYSIEGRKFMCDDSAFYLVYVYANKVEATWDPMLVQAMTLAMKVALAYPITKSQSVYDSSEQEFRRFMQSARTVDSLDEPAQTFGDFRLLSAGLAQAY